MEKAHRIAQEARSSLGEYCMNTCKAYCCRKGTLILSKNEKEAIIPTSTTVKLTVLAHEQFALDLNSQPCPQLGQQFECKAHSHPLRPQPCRDFPVFIQGKKFHFSKRCPAVREGKLYFFEKELVANGLELSYESAHNDSK